jgi:hypothetical protein
MQWVPWLVLAFGVVGGFWLLHRWHARPASEASAAGDESLELPDFDGE